MAGDAPFDARQPAPPESPPQPQAARVYDGAQVDEYIARLHAHADGLKHRVAELEAELAQRGAAMPDGESDQPVFDLTDRHDAEPRRAGETPADDIVDAARREAAELLDAARRNAEKLIAEGERLAAAAVIRVLEHIDQVVGEWTGSSPRRAAPEVVADLRDRHGHRPAHAERA